jgi:CelD/BcsL family acetyltransferase involved in cellulose biosynthesis
MTRVIELRGWDGYPGLLPAWRRLWAEQPDAPAFLHPTWTQVWWHHFGRGRRLRLLLVEEQGRLAAVAPLFAERPLPVPGRLRTVGAGITNDYADWLLPADPASRAACADALFAHLTRRWDWLTLELQGLRPDARLLPLTARAGLHGLLVRPRPGPVCPAVTVDGSWSEYLGTRSASLRWKVRNRQRRLARLGDVCYEHADASTARTAVDELIQLHTLRWAGRPDVSLVSRSARGRAFYRDVLLRLVADGIADVVSLRLNGRAIAAQVGFVVGGTYAYYQIAFDPTMARFDPGTLLVAYLLERAWCRGLRTFDFMTGDEPYKYRWADHDPAVTHVTLVRKHPIARTTWRAIEIGRGLRSRRLAAAASEEPNESSH